MNKELQVVTRDVKELLSTPERRTAFEAGEVAIHTGLLIRSFRIRADGGRGITQQELADRVGVSRARIAALESARPSPRGPSYALIMRLARACGHSSGQLPPGWEGEVASKEDRLSVEELDAALNSFE